MVSNVGQKTNFVELLSFIKGAQISTHHTKNTISLKCSGRNFCYIQSSTRCSNFHSPISSLQGVPFGIYILLSFQNVATFIISWWNNLNAKALYFRKISKNTLYLMPPCLKTCPLLGKKCYMSFFPLWKSHNHCLRSECPWICLLFIFLTSSKNEPNTTTLLQDLDAQPIQVSTTIF